MGSMAQLRKIAMFIFNVFVSKHDPVETVNVLTFNLWHCRLRRMLVKLEFL